MIRLTNAFSAAAQWTAHQMGRGSTFALACLVVVVWAASGPLFHYSDTWQLVINTGTTIVTFLMVFLLQHAQNRDSTAIQLKLDELIRVNEDARNKLLALEDLSEAEVEQVKGTFAKLAVQGASGVELDKAQDQLEGAKEEIEQAQGAIGRAKTRKIR
ncbi:MAG TPA: low affinity iron permease family protein [Lichenihabitans sp.]|nr:low affinity iron permease family protein [Lichenihabitans sp.]